MATIRDVAKKAGVSVATVSAVINKNKFVSEELTKKVEEAIDILEYSPNKIAQGLAKRRSYVFAYLVPSISNPIFARTVEGMEEIVARHDFTVTVVNTNLKIKKYFHDIKRLKGRVDGIAITASHHPEIKNIIKELNKEEIPTVILHSPTNIEVVENILFDDMSAVDKAVNYLVENGHKQIGFIGIEDSITCQRRWKGYKKSLNKFNIFNEELSIFLSPSENNGGQYRITKGIEQIYDILYKKMGTTAIIASSDSLAIDVIKNLHSRDIKIPQEMSIIGFDNTLSKYTWPPLTSIHLPCEEMGKLAGEYLLKANNVKCEVEDIMLNPELKIKGTTAKIGDGKDK